MSENNQPEPPEQSLLDNLWTSLELALATVWGAGLRERVFVLDLANECGLAPRSHVPQCWYAFFLGAAWIGGGVRAIRGAQVL